MFEGEDIDNLDGDQPEEESGNRNFMLAAGILGGIVLLSIACLVGYYALYLRPQAAQQASNQATLVAVNVEAQQILTQTAQARISLNTPTPTITNTPVIQVATTQPAALAADPITVTVAAALTQAAQAQLTVTGLPTTTALPDSGFADQAGLPGLVMVTFALVVVILLARRLRTSSGTR